MPIFETRRATITSFLTSPLRKKTSARSERSLFKIYKSKVTYVSEGDVCTDVPTNPIIGSIPLSETHPTLIGREL